MCSRISECVDVACSLNLVLTLAYDAVNNIRTRIPRINDHENKINTGRRA